MYAKLVLDRKCINISSAGRYLHHNDSFRDVSCVFIKSLYLSLSDRPGRVRLPGDSIRFDDNCAEIKTSKLNALQLSQLKSLAVLRTGQ